jgi:protein phosphatase
VLPFSWRLAVSVTSEFRWTSASKTDAGLVRRVNEDACLDLPERGLWAVADGMGGHAVGELASRLVVEGLAGVSCGESLPSLVADARARLMTVNARLREEAMRRHVQRIGSTVVALIAGERACTCLWAGDSRLYLLRRGSLAQLTRDHSHLEELKARGELSEEDARHHPAQNLITRAVGAMDTLEIDETSIELVDGDLFLLCSDGLSNDLTEEDIARELAAGAGACEKAAQRLVEIALSRGGRDNISAIVVQAEDLFCTDQTQVNPIV